MTLRLTASVEANFSPGKKAKASLFAEAQALAVASPAENRVRDPASLGGCRALLLRLGAEI